MAFFPSPIDGSCCDDPCETQDDPCDPCCACQIPEDYDYIHVATYSTEYAGPSSTCEKKFYVCQSSTTYDVKEDRCGYESGGPEYFPELENWLIGDYENETSGCDNLGAGKYLDDNFEVKRLAYFGTNDEKVIDAGWEDNSGCENCETEINITCTDEEAECGFGGRPCCGSGVTNPCGSGIKPCCGSGTTPCGSGIPPCCGSGTTPCGSGVSGSGVGSGVGSGCCTDPDPCGPQGSGCCTDPDPCEEDCTECYDGEPEVKTFCVEEVVTVCDEESVTPPTSSC